jgi:hypothetical protein
MFLHFVISTFLCLLVIRQRVRTSCRRVLHPGHKDKMATLNLLCKHLCVQYYLSAYLGIGIEETNAGIGIRHTEFKSGTGLTKCRKV